MTAHAITDAATSHSFNAKTKFLPKKSCLDVFSGLLLKISMNLFEQVTTAPTDPILGLSEAFRNDPNPAKINLSVGVYQDASGASPVLECVRLAAKRLADSNLTKGYLPINGAPRFLENTRHLVFGKDNEMVSTGRVASVHTPGGTGALRIVGDFLRGILDRRTIWVSNPTWANHQGIFSAAGLEVLSYPYYQPESHGLNRDGLLTVLENIPENDCVLFHACCHNPTGIDPTPEDWETIAKICKARHLLPVIDFAYQGFASGWIEDALAIRLFAQYGLEFFVCSSFSKNFGLYQDRVGALHAVAKNKDEADRVLSQLKVIVRTNYSNPPAHGSHLVNTILDDPELYSIWEEELKAMRARILSVRHQFVDALEQAGASTDFSFIRHQTGMFSFSGLSRDTVLRLRSNNGIYMVDSGRINVAGINDSNLHPLCQAIVAAL
jgi:aspartate aminotransferase